MGFTEALSEQLAMIAAFPPRIITTAASTVYTGVVDMKYHRRAMVVALGNAYGGTAMVKGLTVTLIDCDASGTAASTAFLTSSTTRVSGTAGQYTAIVLECKAEDLGQYGPSLNAPGRYFKAGITTSTNVKNAYTAIVLVDGSRYGPAEDFDNSYVTEVTQE
jgi:hypothetical protein